MVVTGWPPIQVIQGGSRYGKNKQGSYYKAL